MISPARAETLESLARALSLALDKDVLSLDTAQTLWQRFAGQSVDSTSHPDDPAAA